jgi:hypothetical protein
MPVRYVIRAERVIVTGRSLDWERGTPQLITRRGDTLTIPPIATLEVRLRERTNRAIAGGVIGFLAGVVTSYVSCPPPKRYCGEQDPTPLLGATLGALIGSRIKSDWWVRVKRVP